MKPFLLLFAIAASAVAQVTIPNLPAGQLAGAAADGANDKFAIWDHSASATKWMTIGDVVNVPGFSASILSNSSLNAAIAGNPDASLAAISAPTQRNLDNYSSQLACLAKVSAWYADSGTSTPLRVAKIGDSLAAQGINTLADSFGFAGSIGDIGPVSGGTGTYTFNSTGSGAGENHAYSISGAYYKFEIGATWELSRGGSATGDVLGDKACIGYIKRPTGASFKLQSRAQGESSWTDLATIDSESGDGTTYGVFAEYSIAGNNVYNRLRITTITGDSGDSVIVPFFGIYNSNGGGVIEITSHALTRGGATPAQFMSTPSAVFTPLYTGLAPDLMISCWNDDSPNWQDGGNWDMLYDRTQVIKAATDHIVATAYPNSDSAQETIYAASRIEQRKWCERNKQSFYDIHNLLRGSWAYANSLGLMTDATHPNNAGRDVVMRALWASTQIGRQSLGGALAVGGAPMMQTTGFTAPAGNNVRINGGVDLVSTTGLTSRYSKDTRFAHKWQLRPLSDNITWEVVQGNNVRAAHFVAGSSYFRGIRPYADGYNSLGSPSYRWRGFYGAAENWRVQTKTADYAIDSDVTVGNRPYDHTILVDATAGAVTITLPPASNLQDSENISNGRLLIIKKIDSSGNSVIIDGNLSETIDGALTQTITTQWGTGQYQCSGSAWFKIN